MDAGFTDDDNVFRTQVRAFLEQNLPKGLHEKILGYRALSRDEIVGWQRILNKQGWATPSWPKQWGGPGWNVMQRYIFFDELHQFPAPEPLSFNVSMIGPVIATFGTDAQKTELLPKIANLDVWWCQGFSEPEAGSDLAALTTSAVRDGEYYVVNGTKIWQGMGHWADWMFTLVRTDPTAKKQAGISFLLIDMTSPGITVYPIMTIDGRHEVNSVFLDSVRVPVVNRVHQENRGWEVARFLLGHERTGIARIGMSRFLLRHARQLAAQVEVGNGTLADDPSFRRRIAEIEVELAALEITQMRVLAGMNAHGDRPDPRTSILKIKGVELRQAASELLFRVAGPLAFPVENELAVFNSGDAPTDTAWSGMAAPIYFNLRAASIYGGSTEIQKNILARTILGLPK